jgi:hypothetical protein
MKRLAVNPQAGIKDKKDKPVKGRISGYTSTRPRDTDQIGVEEGVQCIYVSAKHVK